MEEDAQGQERLKDGGVPGRQDGMGAEILDEPLRHGFPGLGNMPTQSKENETNDGDPAAGTGRSAKTPMRRGGQRAPRVDLRGRGGV